MTPIAVFLAREGEWWHFTCADADNENHRFKVDCNDFEYGWATVARKIKVWMDE